MSKRVSLHSGVVLTCLLGSVFLLTGCNPRTFPYLSDDYSLHGRRPQVIASQNSCVLDYSEMLGGGDDTETGCEAPDHLQLAHDHTHFDPYAPFADTYCLSRGDILSVSVVGDEDTLVDNAVVAPDGHLYYTVLEGLPAASRSIEEVSGDIRERLQDIFQDPVISITPSVVKGQSFTILGRVQSPGEYAIPSPIRLLDAIGEAGGVLMNDVNRNLNASSGIRRQSTADLKRSFVVRGDCKLDVDFEALLYGSDPMQNIFLRPGDYIFLAPADYREVFVLGEVVDPLRVPFSKGLTLMNVLATSGGWTMGDAYSADMTKLLVIRGSLDCPRVALVDLKKIVSGKARDIYLEPGDIVYVQRKEFNFLREVVRIAIESFVYSFSTSAGDHYAGRHWFFREERKK